MLERGWCISWERFAKVVSEEQNGKLQVGYKELEFCKHKSRAKTHEPFDESLHKQTSLLRPSNSAQTVYFIHWISFQICAIVRLFRVNWKRPVFLVQVTNTFGKCSVNILMALSINLSLCAPWRPSWELRTEVFLSIMWRQKMHSQRCTQLVQKVDKCTCATFYSGMCYEEVWRARKVTVTGRHPRLKWQFLVWTQENDPQFCWCWVWGTPLFTHKRHDFENVWVLYNLNQKYFFKVVQCTVFTQQKQQMERNKMERPQKRQFQQDLGFSVCVNIINEVPS